MYKRAVLLILISATTISLFASTFTISGKISNYPEQKIKLVSVFGHTTKHIDLITTDISGNFNFNLPKNATKGMYKIIFFNKENNDEIEMNLKIIFNNENIKLTTEFPNIYNDIVILESEENKIYYDFLFKYLDKVYAFNSLRGKMSYYDEDPSQIKDSSFYQMATYHNKTLAELNDFITEYAVKNKNRLVSSIIKTYKMPFIDATQPSSVKEKQLIDNYLSSINFNDTILLRTDIINTKVLEYLQLIPLSTLTPEQQTETLTSAIDNILLKAYINENTYDYMLYYLHEITLKTRRNDLIKHIETYINENKCHADNNSSHQEYHTNIINIGDKAPDFEFTDIRLNKKMKLHDIKSQYTILVFWSVNCSHCIKKMPEIKSLYKKYDRKLFDVVCISVDSDEDFYLDYIKTQGLDEWHNYSEFQGWNGVISKLYNVKFTPNIFLIDKNKNIIDKPDVEALDAFFESRK